MAIFPKLFRLSFFLLLPLVSSIPARLMLRHVFPHALLVGHNFHYETVARSLRPAPDNADVNILTFTGHQGLNGDPCESESDCQADRLCVALQTSSILPANCTAEHSHCFCLSFDASCATSAACDYGEVCFRFAHDPVSLCLSEQIVPIVDGSVIDNATSGSTVPASIANGSEKNTSLFVESASKNNGSASVGDGSEARAQGLNGDPCSSMADCQGDRQCIFASSSPFPDLCTPEAFNCLCFTPAACLSTVDCEHGEVCFDFPDSAIKICLSEQYAARVSNENENIGLEPGEAETKHS